MACPAITTGQGFLAQTIFHLDCQAQTLGSLGFQGLTETGSAATWILTGLLTLFIAVLGIRLLAGEHLRSGDSITAMLKVGIVLTLALSWPAYRVLAYDTVLYGPAELAAQILPPDQYEANTGFVDRLQSIDDGILALTTMGTGRQTGSLENVEVEAQTFRGIAADDEEALASGRTTYLWATIGALATVRVATGLLLALAPIFAGLLLFEVTRGLFAGWLRGLAFCALGSLGITVLLTVQLSVMTPWLNNALRTRNLGYATPSAPSELMALNFAFAAASFALLFVLTKVAFQNEWALLRSRNERANQVGRVEREQPNTTYEPRQGYAANRAQEISRRVASTMRREEGLVGQNRRLAAAGDVSQSISRRPSTGPSSGLTYRRTAHRHSASQTRRDRS